MRWPADPHGPPLPVVQSILMRVPDTSPLSLCVQLRLRRPGGDALLALTSYDGRDASGDIACSIAEAFVHLEKLRLELVDQMRHADGAAPVTHFTALAELALLEKTFIDIARKAIDVSSLVHPAGGRSG
jgi:hypothetical protein